MNREEIKACLVETIAEIQAGGGLYCPSLEGGSTPARDVPEFTSEVGIAATTILSQRIGIAIPVETNLFYNKEKGQETTIDQIIESLVSIQDSLDEESSE